MTNRKNWPAVLAMALVLGTAVAGTANAQANIQGAWETRNGGNVWVISFVEDTFVIYRNGEMFQYGTYTLNPAAWGVTVTSNRPQNLLIEFGFERSYNGFTYNISANELVLSNPLRSHDGYLILGQGGLPLGTYRRGSEPAEAGNPLVGVWRLNYIDNEGEVGTEIYRFFPNGKGVLIGFPQKYKLYDAGLLRVTYELGTTPGTGQVSLWRVDTNTPNWESVVFRVLPFAIDGNILRFEGISAEYRKR